MLRGSGRPVAGVRPRKFSVRLLATAIAVSAATLVLAADGIRAAGEVRTISIYNIHTKETLTVTFKRDGVYDQDGLDKINHMWRDWRVDEEIKIDPKLIDLLWELHTQLDAEGPIHLISGHRSERTNDMLRRTRGGQAKKSLHIAGKAADVFFPGVPLERLRNAALVRERGGVGYYPRSGVPFVHIDTGRVRHWPYIPETELASIMRNRGNDTAPETSEGETTVAAAVFDTPAPRPRAKPLTVAEAPHEPVELALAGESALAPSRPGGSNAGAIITTTGRDWGQSWLLPTRSRDLEPDTAPAGRTGAARVIVASADTPGAPKSDAPLSAMAAAGYAAPVVDDRRDRLSGLIGNSPDDLPRLLAEAELLQGEAAGESSETGQPIDLRPAVLIHSRAELPSPRYEQLPAPVMTASLGPAAVGEPLASYRPTRAPTSVLGGTLLMAPSSQPRPVLKSGPALFASLLTRPTSSHTYTFAGRGAVDLAAISTFASPGNATSWRVSRDRSSDGAGDVAGELVAFAERAFGWIFGN